MVVNDIGQLRGALSVLATKSTVPRIDKARKALCKEIIHDTESFVPYDTGHLSSSVSIQDGGRSIAYTADYAEYVNNMPFSNNFDRAVHSHATSKWFEASLIFNRSRWIEDFKTLVGGK